MQAHIQKWGNSLGLRIPKNIANKLRLQSGKIVDLTLSGKQLIISLKISELDLLIDNITDENLHCEKFNCDENYGNEQW